MLGRDNQVFNLAFDNSMKYEIGPSYDPSDIACINGDISTRSNRVKCGYVNHPSDPGGETKYGISKVHNSSVDITNLRLEEAKEIYFKNYWALSNCDRLPVPLAILHFDSIINHGTRRAVIFLQKSVGAKPDGVFGPQTLNMVDNAYYDDCVIDYLEIRRAFFKRLAKQKPKLRVFKKGWLARVDGLEKTLKEFFL